MCVRINGRPIYLWPLMRRVAEAGATRALRSRDWHEVPNTSPLDGLSGYDYLRADAAHRGTTDTVRASES
eukprot:1240738-Prymnesium_polylepis.1